MAELVISTVEVVATPRAVVATADLAIVGEEFLSSNWKTILSFADIIWQRILTP